MRDADVRLAVRELLAVEHAGDLGTRIVEEMGVWSGSVRVDIAVINGELVGYELKSDRDTLSRLPQQADLYSRLFDRVHLVVGSKHSREAKKLIPKWWGVHVATSVGSRVHLYQAREAKPNPKPDPLIIAQTLWREEALAILERRGLAKGWKSKTAVQLHSRVAGALSLEDLRAEVRAVLKQRQGWLGEPVDDQLHVAVSA
jgi:hypothetical protein